jgi:acyl-CoA thioesterase FadM
VVASQRDVVGEHPCGGQWSPTTRASLSVVDEHVVGDADTDHLGHMSIRRYPDIAERGVRPLLEAIGLDDARLRDMQVAPMVVDAYSRQYREQYAGANLRLAAGILDADRGGVVVYAELSNSANRDLAGTFVQWVRLLANADRTGRLVPDDAVDAANVRRVDWPDRGRPRSLALAPLQIASPRQLQELALERWNDGHVDAGSCDERGWFLGSLSDLAWGVERDLQSDLADEERSWLHLADDGRSLGLTNVEHRRVLVAVPKARVQLRTLAANIAIGSNHRVRREWTFDPANGRVYAAGDFVDLVFDAETRRAVEIPAAFRAELERWYHPELG